ncbi:hypothetical protein FKM82_007751 [Ascaphus truei]
MGGFWVRLWTTSLAFNGLKADWRTLGYYWEDDAWKSAGRLSDDGVIQKSCIYTHVCKRVCTHPSTYNANAKRACWEKSTQFLKGFRVARV